MSKLQDLIKELCPDGVEFMRMDEVFEMRNGYTPSKANDRYWNNGTIPWFRMEDIRQNGRILSDSIQHITKEAVKGGRLFPANSFIIATTATIGEHALIIADSLANQRFTNLTIRKSLVEQILDKYLFYYLFIVGEWCKNNTNISGFASVDMSKFRKLEIPIPPIEVQNEIVRILDTFTSHAAELQAELQARKEQYEYYRNKLLSFDENDEGVKWMKLGEIGSFKYGFTDKAKKEGEIRYIRITDIMDNGCLNPNDAMYINASEESSKYLLKEGDILVARTGATFGKTLYLQKTSPSVYASFLIKIDLNNELITNKFYWYFSKSKFYWKQANKLVSRGGQQQFNANAISQVEVPIPPLSEQQRIVSILDKFESLVNDLTAGLPAEIAAVQEQYEYYRNKLLTFKRIS